jgi:hypothetical protein
MELALQRSVGQPLNAAATAAAVRTTVIAARTVVVAAPGLSAVALDFLLDGISERVDAGQDLEVVVRQDGGRSPRRLRYFAIRFLACSSTSATSRVDSFASGWNTTRSLWSSYAPSRNTAWT